MTEIVGDGAFNGFILFHPQSGLLFISLTVSMSVGQAPVPQCQAMILKSALGMILKSAPGRVEASKDDTQPTTCDPHWPTGDSQ